MTRETQIIWRATNGNELLRHKHGDVFYIPLSEVDPKTMRELRDALSDALSDELVQAVNAAKALREMLECNHELGAISRPVADQARAALAKAEGREP